jgi:hypothetical protein
LVLNNSYITGLTYVVAGLEGGGGRGSACRPEEARPETRGAQGHGTIVPAIDDLLVGLRKAGVE